jgi:NAD(P)-dependent dehydrogenase (short-subunit alcohol dehydrogenase family)
VGKLDGKIVLVTGGASGIGRAASLVCAREGARLVIADLNLDGAKETAERIGKAGGEARTLKTNVALAGDANAAVAFAVETYGRLDGAFNNAGIIEPSARFTEATEESFDRVIAVNVKGVWNCMRAELSQMVAQGSGSIVNTASVAGLRSAGRMAIYGASKHAVVGLTKTAALEYARTGLRINAVCPGVIDTPMLQSIADDSDRPKENFVRQQPNRRLGLPEEIAEAVAWLLSDAASFVTGVAMPVDGGMMA